jgi:hypothetical protein
VRRLSGKMGVEFQLGWDAASRLHVWGLHEARLEVEDVKAGVPLIRGLVELTEED